MTLVPMQDYPGLRLGRVTLVRSFPTPKPYKGLLALQVSNTWTLGMGPPGLNIVGGLQDVQER